MAYRESHYGINASINVSCIHIPDKTEAQTGSMIHDNQRALE